MDSRVGRFDLVIWIKKLHKLNTVQIGIVDKVSQEYKNRIGDGGNYNLCGEPIYSWIYPKFYPSELPIKIRPDLIKLVNRNFGIGDLVKRENNKIGFIQNILYTVTIKLLNYDLILYDVNVEQLKDSWNSDVIAKRHILYKGWIGVLSSTIERSVYLKLNNCQTFQMNLKDFENMVLLNGCVKPSQCTYEVNGFAFYPGRKFFIMEKSLKKEILLDRIQWMESPPQLDMSSTTVIIEIIKTEVLPLNVNWIYQVDYNLSQPPQILKLDNLKKVIWICPIQKVTLGDVRLYKMTPADWESAVNQVHWDTYLIHKYSLLRGNRRRQHLAAQLPPVLLPFDENFELDRKTPVEILQLTSKVEVGWITGYKEILDSVDVMGVKSSCEFSIGLFVQRKDDNTNWKDKYGVIQRVSLKVSGNSAIVRWITRKQGCPNFLGENIITTEDLNLKNLEKHLFYDFSPKSNQNIIVASKVPQGRYHEFKTGFVINTYPDGMVRARDTSGKLCILWPDELVRAYPRIDNKYQYNYIKSKSELTNKN